MTRAPIASGMSRAEDGYGRTSAAIIPPAAASANPTNGWRGALNKFMGGRSGKDRASLGSLRRRTQLEISSLPSYFSSLHDLFSETEGVDLAPLTGVDSSAPLATRMRPRSLDEFVGQEHILAPGKLLRRAIEADRLPSVILSGPPGTGKTTLAHIIADMTHAKFVRLSGVESNVAEMRRVIAGATNRTRTSGQKTILFIDEIHHFNKAQQDILLPDVESGNLRLIGATTYNPFFYVNSPLVSRSQVFQLEPLRVEQLEELIDRALADNERGLGNYKVKIDKNARKHLAKLSDGDARKCLNALEIGVLTTPPAGGTTSVSSKSS